MDIEQGDTSAATVLNFSLRNNPMEEPQPLSRF